MTILNCRSIQISAGTRSSPLCDCRTVNRMQGTGQRVILPYALRKVAFSQYEEWTLLTIIAHEEKPYLHETILAMLEPYKSKGSGA